MGAIGITEANMDGSLKEVIVKRVLMPNGEVVRLGKTIMRPRAPEDESLEYVKERSDDVEWRVQKEPESQRFRVRLMAVAVPALRWKRPACP